MVVSDAATGTASAVSAVVAAVPQTAGLVGTSIRASIPGIPAGGSINPLNALPSMPSLPSVGLPGLPELPQLPGMPNIPLPTVPEVSMPSIPRVTNVSFKDVGVPFGEWVGLPEGKSLLPSARFAWSEEQQLEEEASEIHGLTQAVDLDALRVAFTKYAGADERMDEDEFKLFTKHMKMAPHLADNLWRMFDSDGNGIVDAEEFSSGIHALTQARAWLRYCPTCDYDRTCPYCIEVQACAHCTRERFCADHWKNHPDVYSECQPISAEV